MLDISNSYEVQRKRVQSFINTKLGKGVSINKALSMVKSKYGISVKDVGLTKAKGEKKFIAYKSKSARNKAKKAYEQNKYKNIHRLNAQKQGFNNLLQNYSNKYLGGIDLSKIDTNKLLKKTGINKSWKDMSPAEWYESMSDISDYASDLYLENPDINEEYIVDDEEKLLYEIGQKMYEKSTIW